MIGNFPPRPTQPLPRVQRSTVNSKKISAPRASNRALRVAARVEHREKKEEEEDEDVGAVDEDVDAVDAVDVVDAAMVTSPTPHHPSIRNFFQDRRTRRRTRR